MASIWLDTFLGLVGKYIVLFIDRYYIFVLPPVVLYGLFLTIASINLKRIEGRVFREVIRQGKILFEADRDFSNRQIMDIVKIDWNKFIKNYSFFPYISSHNSLWVSKTNMFNVREHILSEKTRIIRILEENGLIKTT
jgi:hypothetical protein